MTLKGSSANNEPGYKLELHKVINQGVRNEEVMINDSTLSREQLIGAVITDIIPDDIGDMFILKLKDGREITVIDGINSDDFLFIHIVGPDEPFNMMEAYSLAIAPTEKLKELLRGEKR